MAKSILIADDNPSMRQALNQVFTSKGDFEVCGEAVNGREAVDKALELRPDLIVLDLSMPVMNGIDAARLLRQSLPETPIILFSQYGDRFSEEEARSIGFAALVSKTDSFSTLLRKARLLMYPDAA